MNPSRAPKNFWRVFAGITFINQLIRVPLLLSLASSINDLEAYFIITATSIPVQFFAHEILQYRNKSHQVNLFERYGIPFLILGSIIYVTWHHGGTTGGVCSVFACALLLYSSSVGLLREISSAQSVLAVDAMYNTGTTLLACAVAISLTNTSSLGLTILLAQASVAVCMTIFIYSLIRRSKQNAPLSLSPVTVGRTTESSAPLVLAGIMATTQLERLVIAATHPIVLACISLAAGTTQALRKIGMDDAIVYEALRNQSTKGLYQAMSLQLRQARKVFYVPLLLALVANFFIHEIADLSHQLNVLRSLDHGSFSITATILCVYLAAMPPALIVINTIRLRIVPLHRLGSTVLICTMVIMCIALLNPETLAKRMDLPLILIILNASLSYMLFMALSPTPLIISFRLLWIDIAIFLTTVSILWLLFH